MVIKYLLAELNVSIFLITPILQQGILELVFYDDLVINSKELLGDSFEKRINCYKLMGWISCDSLHIWL